ncbi:unnamed protein product [Miscanthus lutarioriparius]|uniref:Uncharacterized protein n=1 Tax=Miscanthus lutarioriparius TaxID=422564 RepID=A0A811SAC6_9POAL|nr:unnamed protein product [Miscanthus lutarioriparius]
MPLIRTVSCAQQIKCTVLNHKGATRQQEKYRLIQEERPEPAGGRGRGHEPHHNGYDRWHCREQRRESPHGGLEPAPACSCPGTLQPDEAEEEQQERGVREQHERDGRRVVGAPGVVDGETRVYGQNGAAYDRQAGILTFRRRV